MENFVTHLTFPCCTMFYLKLTKIDIRGVTFATENRTSSKFTHQLAIYHIKTANQTLTGTSKSKVKYNSKLLFDHLYMLTNKFSKYCSKKIIKLMYQL